MAGVIINPKLQKALEFASNVDQQAIATLQQGYASLFTLLQSDAPFVAATEKYSVDVFSSVDVGLRSAASGVLASYGFNASAKAVTSFGVFSAHPDKQVGRYDSLMGVFRDLKTAQEKLKRNLASADLKGALDDLNVFVSKDSGLSLFQLAIANRSWDLVTQLSQTGYFDLSKAPLDGEHQGDHALFLWLQHDDHSKAALICLEGMLDEQPQALQVKNSEGFYPLGKMLALPLPAVSRDVVHVMMQKSLACGMDIASCGFDGDPLVFSSEMDALQTMLQSLHPDLPVVNFIEDESDSLPKNITLSPVAIAAFYENVPAIVALVNAGESVQGVTSLWQNLGIRGVGSRLYFTPEVRSVLYLAEALQSYAKGDDFAQTASLLSRAVHCQEDVVLEMLSMAMHDDLPDQLFVLMPHNSDGKSLSLFADDRAEAKALLMQLKDVCSNDFPSEVKRERMLEEEAHHQADRGGSELVLQVLSDAYPSLTHVVASMDHTLRQIDSVTSLLLDAMSPTADNAVLHESEDTGASADGSSIDLGDELSNDSKRAVAPSEEGKGKTFRR